MMSIILLFIVFSYIIYLSLFSIYNIESFSSRHNQDKEVEPTTNKEVEPTTNNVLDKMQAGEIILGFIIISVIKSISSIYDDMRGYNKAATQYYDPNSKYKINQPNPYFEYGDNYYHLSSIK